MAHGSLVFIMLPKLIACFICLLIIIYRNKKTLLVNHHGKMNDHYETVSDALLFNQ